MSEQDWQIEVVRSVRDVGVTPPDLHALRHRVASAVACEAGAARARRGARALAARVLVPGIAVAVAIAVFVIALAGLRSSAPDRAAESPTQGLIARLAVLRRPQTAADRLPSPLHLRSTSGNGPIIPSLTRLAATPPGARIYLVVTRPAVRPTGGAALQTWNRQLGDQVATVTVTRAGASETAGQPAVDLSDGLELQATGDIGPRRHNGGTVYQVGVVPDGVARATWTYRILRLVNRFATPTKRTIAVHPQITGNVAYSPEPSQPRQLVAVHWYAPDGSHVPTSAHALVQATQHRQAVLRAQALKAVEHSTYRADPRLLSAFAVFSITSPVGVRLANGVTISDPPLSSLPYSILNWLEPNDAVTKPDPHATREITMPSGIRFFVIAGQRGLCVGDVDPGPATLGNPALAGLASGGGEGCAPSIASALTRGTGVTSTNANGSTIIMITPKAHPSLTIRTGAHSHRTVRPPFGVYATHVPFRSDKP
jgi:hypothetical protein